MRETRAQPLPRSTQRQSYAAKSDPKGARVQYARVPIELVELDPLALQLYVALCGYARRGGYCYPSNARLSKDTRQSSASITRSLRQLVELGVVERQGRQRRMLRVVPIESLSISSDRKTTSLSITSDQSFRSPVIDITRCSEVEDDTLADARASAHDESETVAMSDDQLFEIEPLQKPEPVGTTKCMRAFFDAYGDQPLSRNMIGRLGRTFKTLCETYDDELVAAAAAEMGTRRVANPNAVESFVLQLRRRQQIAATGVSGDQAQQSAAQWSAIARDTFDQWRADQSM